MINIKFRFNVDEKYEIASFPIAIFIDQAIVLKLIYNKPQYFDSFFFLKLNSFDFKTN